MSITCRGSVLLGNGCGKCDKCKEEIKKLNAEKTEYPIKQEKLLIINSPYSFKSYYFKFNEKIELLKILELESTKEEFIIGVLKTPDEIIPLMWKLDGECMTKNIDLDSVCLY